MVVTVAAESEGLVVVQPSNHVGFSRKQKHVQIMLRLSVLHQNLFSFFFLFWWNSLCFQILKAYTLISYAYSRSGQGDALDRDDYIEYI